jgi:hypothetical protein
MNPLFRILIAKAPLGVVVALSGSLCLFAAHAAYESVSVKSPVMWRSSEPGPGLLPDWKIEFQNPLKDFVSFEKRI